MEGMFEMRLTIQNQHTTGLYRPQYEHDACGIGFYADIKGRPSHEIVTTALEMLARLDHRAGKSSDNESSDGAGILLQIPHEFFISVCPFPLPELGSYAAGMLFMPQDIQLQNDILAAWKKEAASLGLSFIGERAVPVNPDVIGKAAREAQPQITQIFLEPCTALEDALFQKKLYVLRKKIEKQFSSILYVASLSNQTIVYKGMLSAEQLPLFYSDLRMESFCSSIALIHSRFSTNTFPSWDRAHPNRMLAHNGEINTIKGNENWFNAKTALLAEELTDLPIEEVTPIIQPDGSDSAMFDNVLEFITLNGASLAQSIMMMVPEPWEQQNDMPPFLKAFYQYHSQLMEPWDGPMALGFTNGKQIGATLDRNGLRPGRYYLTKDDKVIFASEVGVVDIPDEQILERRSLKPGELLFVDTEQGRILSNEELKTLVSTQEPYSEYNESFVLSLNSKKERLTALSGLNPEKLLYLQRLFGYTYEEVTKSIKPMVEEMKESTGSMGLDTPLAVLSERPQLLYHYFKQGFSQVTNPPIDALREECVISTLTWLGAQTSFLRRNDFENKRILLEHPFLDTQSFFAIQNQGIKTAEIQSAYSAADGEKGLETALESLFTQAEAAIEKGAALLILSDRLDDTMTVPIPALLVTSALHHYLIKKGLRPKVSLIIDSGEPRDPHHMAMLLGYGADAVHPYLAFETLKSLVQEKHLSCSYKEAVQHYLHAVLNGVVKIMSKVGISAIQSYRGAKTFEAIGISTEVMELYFTGTPSQISGIGLKEIAAESLARYQQALKGLNIADPALEAGSELQWRKEGEFHQFNPLMIHTLQRAARTNDKTVYKKFVEMQQTSPFTTIRSMLSLQSSREPIALDEVESIEAIFKRFKSGAMSYGSLSKEAHEALAIAMNRIGGKSNSGEGGEEESRYTLDENGDSRRSAIKQVASGRFGVTSHYLTESDEIQIKMAQGAKPGEGGQLPGSKVYPWIAEVRRSTPGVGLISPPPHHDIYSIEDLAQLIHDLKSANPYARISVKLVAKAGVGTIAAGVAKGLADTILISGHDGGTGASPRSSIKHAGVPWELGLSEAHQTLVLNGLRDRVTLEVDGKLMSGRDVLIAACLGAEEYGFATAPLVALGCIMMRACHLDTCPVGVATQNPKLREKFMGSPDHIVNYLTFIAEEIRELLAELGFRSLKELVGQTHLLCIKDEVQTHWKAKHLNLEDLLFQPLLKDGSFYFKAKEQEHQLDSRFDQRNLLPVCEELISNGQKAVFTFPIRNTDRTVGTTLGYSISKAFGAEGLPKDTIELVLKGSAGQSLGAFIPKGLSIMLEGDANDYVGKGLSGGTIIIKPGSKWDLAHPHTIIGNTTFFGATSGEAYIRGGAGQRFCVRNSGAYAVVEGVGDHGCEYMTGGRVAVLGPIGKNFAAGMSGGVAYIYAGQDAGDPFDKINHDMVSVEDSLTEQDRFELYQMIEKHYHYTSSPIAGEILRNWSTAFNQFLKVIPLEYKSMTNTIDILHSRGMSASEAELEAFRLKQSNLVLDPVEEAESFSTELKG